MSMNLHTLLLSEGTCLSLINSFHSQHLISESAVEMTRIMQMDMIFSVQKIDALLRKSPNNVQYLLLLDGLNEVARKQLSIPGNDYMGSPLEFNC